MEDDVVGLGETHDKDEEDGAEPDEIICNHPVDHGHEWTSQLEPPAKQCTHLYRHQLLFAHDVHILENKYAVLKPKFAPYGKFWTLKV